MRLRFPGGRRLSLRIRQVDQSRPCAAVGEVITAFSPGLPTLAEGWVPETPIPADPSAGWHSAMIPPRDGP